MEAEMRKIEVFDSLETAPFGAIIVYQLNYTNNNNQQNTTILVAFDDGNSEVVWSAGGDLVDALKMASIDYQHYFAGTSMERENPFQEVLDDLLEN